MCFHRNLADAEFATHLLVQKSPDHQRHHLLFARAKRRVTIAEFLQLCVFIQSKAAALKGLPESAQQRVSCERLGQEFDCTRFHRLDSRGDVAVARNEDDRDMASFAYDPFLQIKTAET